MTAASVATTRVTNCRDVRLSARAISAISMPLRLVLRRASQYGLVVTGTTIAANVTPAVRRVNAVGLKARRVNARRVLSLACDEGGLRAHGRYRAQTKALLAGPWAALLAGPGAALPRHSMILHWGGYPDGS